MIDLAAKIAQLEALRPIMGDAAVNAAIAALHAEASEPSEAATPTTQQTMEAHGGSSIASSPMTVTGGDLRDAALGSGNLVLHDIVIAPGGTLQIGALPVDLPPQPAAIQQALSAYLRTLLERYQLLNLQGLSANSQQARITLRSVFVDLQTSVRIGIDRASFLIDDQKIDSDVQQWIRELLNDAEISALSNVTWPKRTRLPDGTPSDVARARILQNIDAILTAPRTALELIRHHRALVLLGDAGSGKTTVLRQLALSFAHARLGAGGEGAAVEPEVAWHGPLPLPILVQLRRFADELTTCPVDAGPLLDHIERQLCGDRLDALANHLLARLEAGEVLLLLDGLDEVADPTRRSWVLAAVARLQSRFASSRVVVTSRIYAYRDAFVLPPPFQVATLQPLEPAAQDDFIARWYRAALLGGSELAHHEQEAAAASRARDMSEALERRPRLREIAGNPLLLTMIALLHWSGMGLPQQRAELYERCLLLLLEQWDQRRPEGGLPGLANALGLPDQLGTSSDRLALIQPIAYQLQLLGREEARNNEVRNWLLERFLDLANNDGTQAKQLIGRFLSFLEGRSGLLIARDVQDRYAFPHKTFQEYLVARELLYLGTHAMQQEVLAQRHAPTWREVILLVVGHLVASGQPEQARLLGWKLLEADEAGTSAFYRSVALAGEIVEELGSNLGRDGRMLRDEVMSELVALVQGSHLSARERVAAALMLDRLGCERVPMPDQPTYWCAVEKGSFWYGDDNAGDMQQSELPYDFKLARYPVTNAEYARFIDAGGYTERRWWTEHGWAFLQPGGHPYDEQDLPITLPRLWNDSRFNSSTQPIVGISWYEAAAYCIWLTQRGHAEGWLPTDALLRLPTSFEWERAARHTDKRCYPWDTGALTPEYANYDETEIGLTSPIGCFPRGAAVCGAEEMLGNVFEWLATNYRMPDALDVQKDFAPDSLVLLSWTYYGSEKEQVFCGARILNDPYNWSDFWSFRLMKFQGRSV